MSVLQVQYISVTTYFPGTNCYIVANPLVSCNIVSAQQLREANDERMLLYWYSQTVHVVLNQEYIFSDIIIYLWDRSYWSTKNIYDWVTYKRAHTIVL